MDSQIGQVATGDGPHQPSEHVQTVGQRLKSLVLARQIKLQNIQLTLKFKTLKKKFTDFSDHRVLKDARVEDPRIARDVLEDAGTDQTLVHVRPVDVVTMATVKFSFVVKRNRHVEPRLVVDGICFVVAAVDQTPDICINYANFSQMSRWKNLNCWLLIGRISSNFISIDSS